jgi:peptidoglycan hydrolase-like protein with peptidoglycan-binding domain
MLKKFLIGTFFAALLFVGTVVSASYDFGPTTLKVGSTGDYVKTLQTVVGATADGNFGPLTKAAVMAWQANNGLVADGLFGNLSKAKANLGLGGTTGDVAGCPAGALFNSLTGASCTTSLPAGCTAGALFSSTTGLSCASTPVVTGLTGTYGTISSMTQLSQYSGEEVGAGQSDVKVAGSDIKASKDGDIQLTAMKIYFDSTGNDSGDSDRIIDYVSSVSVWLGSTEVATADTADFARISTGVYSMTVPLTGAIVKADTTSKLYLTVDVVSNLDSGDIAGATEWSIAIENIRYVDGSGVTTTDTASIPANMDYDTAGNGVNIEFVSYSSASDTELKISDNTTPVAQVVKVSTSANTDNVALLKGKLQVKGTSDVWLDALPITLTSTGAGDYYIDAIANSVTLTIDGKEFTESLGTNCVAEANFSTAGDCGVSGTEGVMFDNLDLTIPAGTTINFSVSADINDIENSGTAATDFDEGDTLVASLTTAGRAYIVAENEEGEQLTNSTEMTGSLTGKAQAFRSSGIQVALVSTSATVSHLGDAANVGTDADQGTYTVKFSVTAFGSDAYVDKDAVEELAGTTATQVSYYFEDGNSNGGDMAAGVGTLVSTGDAAGTTSFKVTENETETFTLTVLGTASADTFNYVAISGIGYNLTSNATACDTVYSFNLDDFKTADLYLNDY